MLEVLIVDDERLARARLRRLLASETDIQVTGEAENATALREHIRKHVPHVVILDIEMQGEDGISLGHWLASLPDPPAVLFVTAHREFALDAFSARAAGYLLKPVSAAQLLGALHSVQRPTRAMQTTQQSPPAPVLAVLAGRRSRRIPANEILAFRAEDKGVTAFTRHGRFFVDGSLKEFEARFERAGFLRAHRAWLISREAVRTIERDAVGHHWLEIDGVDEPVPVSRRQLSHLQACLRP
jgi:two-component system response regulator AlgR